MKKAFFVFGASLLLLQTSCVTVKPWEKMYVNDELMELKNPKLQIYETNFEAYREGAAGAEGGTVGGGCGCN